MKSTWHRAAGARNGTARLPIHISNSVVPGTAIMAAANGTNDALDPKNSSKNTLKLENVG